GMSGADVHYFDVRYVADGVTNSIALIIKNAPLHERLTTLHLSNQGVSVPFAHALDTTTDEAAPLCIQMLAQKQPQHTNVERTAWALAEIHAANFGRKPLLPWLKPADIKFTDNWVIQACWRNAWDRLLNGGGFVDGYGNEHGGPKAGGNFSAEFTQYTPTLEAAATRFRTAMQTWWQQDDALTLIHADLHGDHTFTDGHKTFIIDWGGAQYGPLYLDLPNYFTREESLLYRAALAELGHNIPEGQFLASYDAASAYPGFKYFGIGLWNWCYGDPPHQRDNVLHFINMLIE
ncbi:MAG: phosphotransferase, partial [Candidatus Promineifilaceae bacterium]